MYEVFKETDPESNLDALNNNLHFKIEKSTENITFWIDAKSDQYESILNGLENNEKVECIKKN